MLVTEDHILHDWNSIIISICNNYKAYNLSSDEKLSAAYIGFIKAVRTYQPGYGPFRNFMYQKIISALDDEKLKISRQKRTEQFGASLDRSVKPYSDNTFSYYLKSNENIEKSIEYTELFSCFSNTKKQIVMLLETGYSKAEIIDILSISQQQFKEYMFQIKESLKKYYM